MSAFILSNIPFNVDLSSLQAELEVKPGYELEILRELAKEARSVAKPKAAYKVLPITDKGADYVIVGGVRLASRVLRRNLDLHQRVFPFVATGGAEIEHWAQTKPDPYRQWTTRICEVSLRCATAALARDLEVRFRTGPTARLNPGSTRDWPLEGQESLFAILGEAAREIGVTLTRDYWMQPTMSTSGLRFPSEEGYENCSLCPVDDCRLRRAPYEKDLYEKRYLVAKGTSPART